MTMRRDTDMAIALFGELYVVYRVSMLLTVATNLSPAANSKTWSIVRVTVPPLLFTETTVA